MKYQRARGIALIIVLAFLVLISGLVLAIFSSSRRELASADSYVSSVNARQLSDMAVGIVQAQISDATKSWEVPDNPATPENDPGNPKRRLTWASQPGLIRTYADDGSAGRTFKLYSSPNMVEGPHDYIPQLELEKEIANDWPRQRGLYVDMNEPVVVADAAGKIKREGDSRTYMAHYPILDAGALGNIEGFKVNLSSGAATPLAPSAVPGFGGKSALAGEKLREDYDPFRDVSDETLTGNPVPMPVKWMYVLADGQVTVPDGWDPDTERAYWDTSSSNGIRPNEKNPIVGRIAFWTDDDCSKLNINTASEGVFWDRAWGKSNNPNSPFGEYQLDTRIPLAGEYQRYPGHPATVCLSPVFGKLNPQLAIPPGDAFSRLQNDRILERYYDLIPRIGWGGTFGGTVATGNQVEGALTKIKSDQNRLYASVDELIFAAPDGRESKANPAAETPRTLNEGLNGPLFARSDLEKMKFFLTAYNRAPDVNVFSRPRISLWMPHQGREPNAGKLSDSGGNRPSTVPAIARNTKDELLAFCSTIAGKYPFYFQRYSIYLGDRINGRTNVKRPFGQLPQYGYEAPSSTQTSLDWDATAKWFKAGGGKNKLRNHELYEYLQNLTSTKVPGWGGSFTDKKYTPAERDQLLTEMIDLVRSGTNSYAQDSKPLPGPHGEKDVRYEYAPSRRMPRATIGESQIVPLVPPNGTPGAGTKGFGRFPTVTEAAFIFYASKVDETTQKVSDMRALLMLEPFTPTAGSWSWSPLVRYVVKGLDTIQINGHSGLFPKEVVNLVTSRVGYGGGSDHWTAFTGTFASFRHWNYQRSLDPSDTEQDDGPKLIPDPDPPLDKKGNPLTAVTFQTGDPELQYNFVSNHVPTDFKDHFTFNAPEEITIEIHTGYAEKYDASTLVQTIKLRFPPSPSNGWIAPADSGNDRDYNQRIKDLDPNNRRFINPAADVVRSVEVTPTGPTKGDLRMIAAMKEIPSSSADGPYFDGYAGTGAENYNNPDTRLVHSLRKGQALAANRLPPGTIQAQLLSGATYLDYPVAARGLKAAMMPAPGGEIPGDFDNGPYDQPDGAYINKPDDYYGSRADGAPDYYEADRVSPNRQIHGPVIFGSLPPKAVGSGATPWRTLLFCANPAAGKAHPGFSSPRDHLLLDLFTMPIVEPYAISEPFSTAGRVNINFELAPFTYIRRDTAFRGVLKSTRMAAFPTGADHKAGNATIYRKAIDPDQTTALFYERFGKQSTTPFAGDTGAFRTASEICDMPLVPANAGVTYQSIKTGAFWNANARTGDNSREYPYGLIYSRVTSKSNVFTVHIRAQTLRKSKVPRSPNPGDRDKMYAEWDESKDLILSEYRGSTTLERYIDPSDPNLPDFATTPDATMDEYYKFRVVSTKKFTP